MAHNFILLVLPNKKLAQRPIESVPGFILRWFKGVAMKNRVLIITLLIAALAAFSSVPRANAEPLTVMAIVGVATVLSLSTIDIVASNHEEDNKDMRAQREDTEKMHASAKTTEEALSSSDVAVAARQID
jgi:hypothetical protein